MAVFRTLDKISKFGFTKESAKRTPEGEGVYIFWNDKNVIYIGKSKSLKSRLDSYLSAFLSPKTSQLVAETKFLSTIRSSSELEALLLEALLIKTYLPKYNIQLKDDKHPLYIIITKEHYPRVLTARKGGLENASVSFGPFPSSATVKSVLKLLRKIFPFSQHKLGKRACLYSQIGLCDPCPNIIENEKNQSEKRLLRKKYLKNISQIRQFLKGRFKTVRDSLEKEMRNYSKSENFEDAKKLRAQIEKLDYITQPVTSAELFIDNPNLVADTRKKEIAELGKIIAPRIPYFTKAMRIECFDVAHLGGSYPTASMVTFVDGEPEKKLYRNFRIRQKKGSDDISSMKEVVRRRIRNFSWGAPDLVIVDGGKGQVGIFNEALKPYKIPVVGIAKRFEVLIIPPSHAQVKYIEIKLTGAPLNLVQRLRNEAHRFARRYHHNLLAKGLF